MRPAVTWLLIAVAVIATAEYADDDWVQEEDLEEPYDEEAKEEAHYRRKRQAYVEQPFEEHIRVKRRCDDDDDNNRVRRSASRTPRQVHQYEVHEYTDDVAAPAPRFEEMQAASAEHYHRFVVAPGAPASTRYLKRDSSKGFHDGHYSDKGGKGHKTNEFHRNVYDESDGKKKKFHDHADEEGGHEEQAFGQRGADFNEKKGHKKGHKSKGYHNKYHKDEFKKEHKFYDDFHKSGDHHRYGKFHAKHASDESGKKKVHHVNAGHDFVERGKKGYSNKGHIDADHMGYNGKSGHEKHYDHFADHGKKGNQGHDTHWGYKKNH